MPFYLKLAGFFNREHVEVLLIPPNPQGRFGIHFGIRTNQFDPFFDHLLGFVDLAPKVLAEPIFHRSTLRTFEKT